MAIVVALNNKCQSRAGLSGVINYVANDKKTLLQSGEKLVSGINCSFHSAYDEFMLIKNICTQRRTADTFITTVSRSVRKKKSHRNRTRNRRQTRKRMF